MYFSKLIMPVCSVAAARPTAQPRAPCCIATKAQERRPDLRSSALPLLPLPHRSYRRFFAPLLSRLFDFFTEFVVGDSHLHHSTGMLTPTPTRNMRYVQ